MEKVIITNNNKVFEKYKGMFDVIFLEQGNYMDVLNMTRDKVHKGCEILTHPMAGSLKPNQTPYKSIIVKNTNKKIHYDSVILIENSLESANKFLKFKATPKWSEKILKDFQTVDLSLIENVVNNPMFNFSF
jgi:hypothetical protein